MTFKNVYECLSPAINNDNNQKSSSENSNNYEYKKTKANISKKISDLAF